MESLVNEEVKHLKFGRGSIVEEPAEHIKVRFQSGGVVKTFRFPDAFAGYLAFEKGEAQGRGTQGRTLQTGGGAQGGADGTAKTPQERCPDGENRSRDRR